MATYQVCDDAIGDHTYINAANAREALNKYLEGYATINGDGESVKDGERFADISIWKSEDECELVVRLFANGTGGVKNWTTGSLTWRAV